MSTTLAGSSNACASHDAPVQLPAGQAFWMPERIELHTQFFTRYLFFALAVIYFSTLKAVPTLLMNLDYLMIILGIYFMITTDL